MENRVAVVRCVMVAGAFVFLCSSSVRAEPIKLAEPYTDPRVFVTRIQVTTEGDVLTAGTEGTEKLPLKAEAVFQFRERRLPPAGRDAASLRAVREFQSARLETAVGGHVTTMELPAETKLVVASGNREGVESYSPAAPMTRDAVDLLELPGDPLSLLALLPLDSVEPGEHWEPADWAAQMLAGIEAVESSSLTCTLEKIADRRAVTAFTGKVTGQRLGANTSSEIRGRISYDLEDRFLREGVAAYTIKASVGTVNPGLEATVTVRMIRQISTEIGALSDELISTIPLEASERSRQLVFAAPRWGVRLQHGRGWHLFQALFEGPTQVAILRLMGLGSLICQCNLAPVPPAAAGSHTPLDQFEADIQTSLGPRFRSIVSKEQVPTQDGRFIYRIVVDGEVELTGSKGSVKVPMNWIYYLCADPGGQQVSFVFSVEPALMEQLAGRDRAMVESVEFFRPVTSAAAARTERDK